MVIKSDTIQQLAYMVSYYCPIVALSLKLTVFEMATYWSKIAVNTYHSLIWHVPWGLTPCEFFDESYLARNWNHGAIRLCTFHDPDFALLGTTLTCDRQTTDGQTRRCRKDRAMHSVVRVKTSRADMCGMVLVHGHV